MSILRRLEAIEPKIKAQQGALEPSVYGVINGVSKVDGEIIPNVVRKWEGTIGHMVPSTREPTIYLVEKLEPFILKSKKYKCLYGGRGGMKSRFAQNVFAGDVNSAGTKCYVLRERMKSLKDSIYAGIVSTIKDMKVGGFLPVPSKWEIRNNNGGGFVFGGMQNIVDMKGASDFKRFLMEESESTAQKTIDTLGPTLRGVPEAELWYLWNPQSSNDPMSKEFIVPYQDSIDRDGYYEDEHHLIMKIGLDDNPWFEHDESLSGEYKKDKYKMEKGLMSKSRFKHIWHGAFNDDVDTSVIMSDWFDACIDAHEKLGITPRGARIIGVDPSDTGNDPCGYVERTGIVFTGIREIEAENGNRKMDEACKQAILYNCDSFLYDADGLGATLRDNVDRAFNGKGRNIVAYKGSSSIHSPKALFKTSTALINNHNSNIRNEDVLFNRKSQNIISFAERVYNTYEAVVLGEYKDPDTLVSFDSKTIEPRMLAKMRAEACRTPTKPGDTIRFYTKEELRKGVVMPDGQRVKIPSPNLFDAAVLSFDNSSIINHVNMIDKAHRPRPMPTMRR